jgi:Ulp1 family protease
MVSSIITFDDVHGGNYMRKELFDRAEAERIASMHKFTGTRSSSRRNRGNVVIDYSDPKDRITYLVYPIEQEAVDAITICNGDLRRLNPGVYFNDNLIDLKIKHLLNELPADKRSRIHVFSCHFYAKLTEEKSNMKAAHHLVARWTKSVDIFETDFVLFPINMANHWSLAVLARPGLLVSLVYL